MKNILRILFFTLSASCSLQAMDMSTELRHQVAQITAQIQQAYMANYSSVDPIAFSKKAPLLKEIVQPVHEYIMMYAQDFLPCFQTLYGVLHEKLSQPITQIASQAMYRAELIAELKNALNNDRSQSLAYANISVEGLNQFSQHVVSIFQFFDALPTELSPVGFYDWQISPTLDERGWSPSQLAPKAQASYAEVIGCIQPSASVVRDRKNALIHAIASNHQPLVKFLLARLPEEQWSDRSTLDEALMLAIELKQWDIASCLLQQGAHHALLRPALDNYIVTSLQTALCNSQWQLVEQLLADVPWQLLSASVKNQIRSLIVPAVAEQMVLMNVSMFQKTTKSVRSGLFHIGPVTLAYYDALSIYNKY